MSLTDDKPLDTYLTLVTSFNGLRLLLFRTLVVVSTG